MSPFPVTLPAELDAAVTLKVKGRRDLAEQALNALVERWPGYAPGYYELAMLRSEDGRLDEALRLARFAYAADPNDPRNGLQLLHRLHSAGQRTEARALALAIAPRSAAEAAQIAVLNSYGDYLDAFPRDKAQALLEENRGRYGWIDADNLARRIEAAIDARAGFALIRLGDGEGAFARVDAADEARFAPLYTWMRDDWFRFQFGGAFDAYGSNYEALTRLLMDRVVEADVLGVTYPNWVDHEYAIGSPRGVPCTLNIHRHLQAIDPDPRPVLCDQIVHLHLHDRGLMEALIRRAGGLTAITCLPELPGVLQRRFDLAEADLIAVPREDTAPHLRNKRAVEGAHFPDRFWEVIAQLSRPPGGSWDGRLFIVAAGTLGKFYCTAIKRNGGIALDLGSLVDAWLKLPSRAGYQDQYALEPAQPGLPEPAPRPAQGSAAPLESAALRP